MEIELDAHEVAAWDSYAAAALNFAMTRYPSKPDLAAADAAVTADELIKLRRKRVSSKPQYLVRR